VASIGLSFGGLVLIYHEQIGWFSPLSMTSEWGFTLISIGVDIAVTYLIIDQLLLSDERRTWKVVEEQAHELIASELSRVFLCLGVVTGIINSLAPGEHREKELLEEMRKLAEPANISVLQNNLARLKLFQAVLPAAVPEVINSLTREYAERLGELQLRYSSRFLDPKLVRLMADVENHLRHLGIIISELRSVLTLSEELDTSAYEATIAKDDIQPLLKAFVDAVDDGVYELPPYSMS